ncbi:Mbeg1-like protein [Anaerosporobacter faecicola]|uniref:Mbeg1-like protein n=1 Tax=Anaerosporobacter faecicola TaxID=2718714 RepID=UPI001439FFE1|nr:Mbeg1-like protein [Anaerosporobacter faecicola]
MAEKLTNEQLLLLNNLMYMNEKPFKSITEYNNVSVKTIVNKIEGYDLDDNKDYGSFMTGADWKELVAAIKSDEQLMNMKIIAINEDSAPNGGGGVSAVFVDTDTKEAAVVFRGTAGREWEDNFIGGGKTDTTDGVSTPYQENALEWYRSLKLEDYYVTITGHSKGGNKAKYVTVKDNTVDRCVSFDGQGFSDDFLRRYAPEIQHNQSKIQNCCVEGDFVNILLNDIGTTTYYKGYDYGKGGFAENHCPNTFFNFKEDGTYSMEVGTQDPNMQEVDKFLNSYLRTLSDEDKQKTLSMIGKLVEEGFNGADINKIMDILLKDDNVDYVASLLAYTIKYEQANPELINALKNVLDASGLSKLNDVVDTVVEVTNWKYFDLAAGVAGIVANHLPGFIEDKLRDLVKDKLGYEISESDLEKLLSVIGKTSNDMGNVELNTSGEDLKALVSPFYEFFSKKKFMVEPSKLQEAENQMEGHRKQLEELQRQLEEVTKQLDVGKFLPKVQLVALAMSINNESKKCLQMKNALRNIRTNYTKSEQRIYSKVV